MIVKKKALVVEDEATTAIDLKDCLVEKGFEVAGIVASGEEAVKAAGTTRPDLILMDIRLQGKMNGIDAACEIKKTCDVPIIYVTAYSDDLSIFKATTSGPLGYLLKPFDDQELKIAIDIAMYQHRKEQELREKERTIRALVNAVPDALLLLDDHHRIIALNNSMEEELGNMGNDLVGTVIADLYPRAMSTLQARMIEDVFRSGQGVRFETQRSEQWIETSIHPVIEDDDRIARVVIQTRDITDRKFFEEKLKTEGIQQIERNMEQFQILNDQIRNPLQAIKGYVDLSDTPFRQQINEQITVINDLVTRLDEGWLESEKVRRFLFKHYLHESLDIPGRLQAGGCR